ncbi:hypothetical protein COT95_01480 [Candidatus Falkowbacteria bacterium CG10_big_fil_rev_8_21_14_0_10_37_6]|uniref:Uncharacterized protein n=1 Tax=Candidatus Falkowbacteria bacterium CG10_big_fil_rev_8_21_14_0_10_37_6 TaxID=1974563 RepID=A0A2H0V7A0_9BACT|nr:MAG: hypothetical protein COT95_01480 [Candidatus Falkowbacteria bacterium CG10_big_fil_rev_8_21_14_0_10_37_6]
MTLTLEQFNKLASKQDVSFLKEDVLKLDKKVDKVIIDQLEMKDDIQEIKDTMATKDDVNKILEAVDKVMKTHEDVLIEQASNISAHDRFETRLTNIEGHLNLKPAA